MTLAFPLGATVATPNALSFLEEHGLEPGELLARHQSCDWGDLGPEDKQSNERALPPPRRRGTYGACRRPEFLTEGMDGWN